jgi:hypothetical protein
MKQEVGATREVSRLELWRRAKTHGDPQAWAAFQRGLEETVMTWLYAHPACEAVCRMHNERHYVAQAFAQFQQVVVQGLVDCETLSEVLLSLCASLNGVIMKALRISSRPQAERSHGSAEQDLQGNHGSLEVWNWVQATLSSERERRLAYLLYHCGLSPAEIVRGFPHEWSDVCEVAHVRCIVFERLTKGLICDGHTCV